MSPRRAGDKKTRFTLWLREDQLEEVEELQRELGKESLAEVVRDALDVYRSLLKARENGIRLYFEDSKAKEKGRIWLLPGPPPVGRR
ncbi:MAG: hypothetical protein HY287_03530 [Planctomycetes bacterium]|nr:hypothetical protein [Planctomycetota bacterium]MBI3833382.1 hypothetical protein [Planctomycetota bacterium]